MEIALRVEERKHTTSEQDLKEKDAKEKFSEWPLTDVFGICRQDYFFANFTPTTF